MLEYINRVNHEIKLVIASSGLLLVSIKLHAIGKHNALSKLIHYTI